MKVKSKKIATSNNELHVESLENFSLDGTNGNIPVHKQLSLDSSIKSQHSIETLFTASQSTLNADPTPSSSRRGSRNSILANLKNKFFSTSIKKRGSSVSLSQDQGPGDAMVMVTGKPPINPHRRVTYDNGKLSSSMPEGSINGIEDSVASFAPGMNRQKSASLILVEPAKPKLIDQSGSTTYEIRLKTANKRGIQIDSAAKLLVNLYGTEGQLVDLHLNKYEEDCFKGNKHDIFTLTNLKDIGKLESITFLVDTSLSLKRSIWRVYCVKVIYKNDIYFFNQCEESLIDTRKSQYKIELRPTGSECNVTKYYIEVQTSADNGAGTDATVVLNMFGTKGIIMETALTLADTLTYNKDMFETGGLDKFEVYKPKDIGRLKRIVIWHNGKGFGAAWKLDYVKIKYNGVAYLCEADLWMKRNQVELPAEIIKNQDIDECAQEAKTELDYEIQITSSQDQSSLAGDYKLYLSINGDKGDICDLVLDKAENSQTKKRFDRPDRFFFSKLKNVGNIKRAVVRLEPVMKSGAKLKLNQLVIFYNKKSVTFKANGLLDSNSGIFKSDFEPTKTEQDLQRYHVDVYTGSDLGAGTDANIFLSLIGTKKTVIDLPLNEKNLVSNSNNLFEAGDMDKFVLYASDIGKLKKIEIRRDNSGISPKWQLEQVNIKFEDEIYTFCVNRWVEKDVKLELTPDERNMAIQDKIEFEITVKTGTKLGAGANSNVFLVMYGTQRETNRIQLKNSQTNRIPFQSGKTDVFSVPAPNIGTLKQISLSHDGIDLGSGWFVDEIIIKNVKTSEIKTFPVGRWLDVNEGDGKTALDLIPGIKPEIRDKRY